jgi:hypothetical protein
MMDTFGMLLSMIISPLTKGSLYLLVLLVKMRCILCCWRRPSRRCVAAMRKSLRMCKICWKLSSVGLSRLKMFNSCEKMKG